MQFNNLNRLFKKEVTRREFLGMSALGFASLFGIVGLIEQIMSHAATTTDTASIEPETGTLTTGASVVTDATASNGKAVKFGSSAVNLPTTGNLYDRCAFGVSAGSPEAHSALESLFGAKLKHYVCYYNMGNNGASAWPTDVANWCKSSNHTLDIAWDMVGTNVSFANIIAGNNNASLDAFFQACKGHGDTVVLRMWWEMNDPTGPTKVGNPGSLVSSTAQWVQAWKYVYDRCKRTNGCTNVQFFWCANGSDTGAHRMEEFYPGDSYVDVIGFDTYNQPAWAGGAWHTFDDQFDSVYNRVAAISTSKSIPMAVGETGTVDGPVGGHTKNEWLTQMFTSQRYPRLRQIDYFNYDPWKMNTTTASINVCKQYFPIAVQDTGI
ncbi:MAG TPA: glycosyl hydrolase [Patescibacteria group bacterium]|nr:glycosyl hydrolase [Patescibacteria group bacterium]